MSNYIRVMAAVAVLLTLNACAPQKSIPRERIQAGHIGEVLPPPTQVRLALLSGDEITGQVQSTTDSTVTLVRDPIGLIGSSNVVVVPLEDIDSINVHAASPLGVGFGVVIILVVIALTGAGLSLSGYGPI